jgi:hypothetical protein
MDDILVGTEKVDGVPQGMDMGKHIGTQVNPQKVDGDTNSNINLTSLAIQVPIFGAILEEDPTSPRSTTYAHKGVGGASNKKLKNFDSKFNRWSNHHCIYSGKVYENIFKD